MSRYQAVKENINATAIKCERDPAEIALVAVTKGRCWQEIQSLYHAGQRLFGESRQQEAETKIVEAPMDCMWHFIGTLQKNKVRKIIGHFGLIHSVDTPELAFKISECSQEASIVTPILLQVNITGEISKHGLGREDWKRVIEKVLNLPSIEIKGLMTMAALNADEKSARNCFARLRSFRDELAHGECLLPYLSMGMSHDYSWAIAEGATHLRIGTALFNSLK